MTARSAVLLAPGGLAGAQARSDAPQVAEAAARRVATVLQPGLLNRCDPPHVPCPSARWPATAGNKRLSRAAALAASVVVAGALGAQPGGSAAAWDSLHAAWTRGDTAALARLVAADYRGVALGGRVSTRASLLRHVARTAAGIRSVGARASVTVRDRRVRPLGGGAVLVTAEVIDSLATPAPGGPRVEVLVTRTSDVLERRGGRWQLVAMHETQVTASDTARRAGSVPVEADHRLELMAILLRLSGIPNPMPARLQPYADEVDRHFAPYRDHAAVVRLRELHRTQRFDFDAAIRLALHVTPPPELRARVALDAPPGHREARWRSPAVAAFLDEVRRFAVDSHADQFFAARRGLYDSTAARLRRAVDTRLDLAWFERYFGVTPPGQLRIAPLLGMSRGAAGMRATPADGPPERWIIFQHWWADSAGVPTYPVDTLVPLHALDVVPILAHEVIHPYVDVMGAYADGAAFARSGPRLMAAVAGRVPAELYPDWQALVDDALTRAATARYVLATRGEGAARQSIAFDAGKGHVWTEELAALLGEYEARRREYPTFAAFRPRLAAYFDSLPGRVEALARRFDAGRPRVVGHSVANGATDVDPATTEIVVRVDRPLQPRVPAVLPVPGAAERFPRVTRRALDSTRTEIRIGVALEPGRAYELALNTPTGGELRSEGGAPLAQYVLRFRTRATATAPATAPAAPADDAAAVARVRAELQQLHREVNAAIRRRDRGALERLHAPEFVQVHAFGYADARAAHLDQLLQVDTTGLRVPSFAEPGRLLVYGDAAVYRFRGGTAVGTRAAGVTVYARHDGRWRFVHGQGTEEIPEPRLVSLSAAVLDRYVGRYDLGDGRVAVLTREATTLIASDARFPRRELFAVSDSQFVNKAGATWTFHRGPNGRVTHFVQRFRDREWRGVRVR